MIAWYNLHNKLFTYCDKYVNCCCRAQQEIAMGVNWRFIIMKAILKLMQKKNSGIPDDTVLLFEHIAQSYQGDECNEMFCKAMDEYLTREQRFQLFEQYGSCNGARYDNEREAFYREHADKPLAERLEHFVKSFGKNAVLHDDNTITVEFACNHGYYKHARRGDFHFPASVETYFERCAGGRMYELQKALGVKLKIKSVDVSPLNENILNPVKFTYEIVNA